MAVATISAEAGTATTAPSASADTKIVLLYRMIDLLVVGDIFVTSCPLRCSEECRGTFELHAGPNVSRH